MSSSYNRGPQQVGDALDRSLLMLGERIKARAAEKAVIEEEQRAFALTPPASAPSASVLRMPPDGDEQQDFFVPSLYDIPLKDGVDLMDVAVFRLSKSQTRRGDLIRYQLSDAIIEVAGGAHGMATIWDYDLVLMMISHLANATRLHRDGRGEKPTNRFRPHAVEILRFCRLPDGGQQYENLSHALDRLQGTFVKITHTDQSSRKRRQGYFPLLGGAQVISKTDTGKISQVELIIPDWIVEGVCNHKTPEVLTVHPDYLLIRGGLARFVYRLARKAAGPKDARYGFRTVHQRSGSTRDFKKFAHDLRGIIKLNDLPGYNLEESKGADGPILVMTAKPAGTGTNGK